MAIEIEKKYRISVEQHEFILEGLNEFAAEFIGEEFEVNSIYGGGVLKEKKAALRVRKIGEKTILTFKQRIENEFAIKQQIEFETEVTNAEQIEKIIENLGFQVGLIYEKRRKTWKFKNVEIVLDELPFGLFMEIEGKMTDIALVEMLLEADNFEVEHETYPSLTKNLGKENGNIIEARFD